MSLGKLEILNTNEKPNWLLLIFISIQETPSKSIKGSPWIYSLSICDALVWDVYEHFNGKISLKEMDP